MPENSNTRIAFRSKPISPAARQAIYIRDLTKFAETAPLKPPHPLIPGIEFIGCGYDVFGEYASPNAVVGDIFNFTKAKSFTPYAYKPGAKPWSVPAPVVVKPIGVSSHRTRSGTSILEYSEEWKTDTGVGGGFLFFGGEAEATFASRKRYEVENYFTSVQFNQPLYSLRLDVTVAEARELLLPAFKEDLESGSPDRLFATYGTHVLTGIVMGGALSQSTVTDQQQYNSSVAIDVAAKASFDIAVVRGSASISSEMKSAVSEFRKHSYVDYQAVGGDPTLRAGASDSKAKFDEWVASIPGDPAPIDFIPFAAWPSLVPVWELATSAARRRKLKEAYKGYAQAMSAKVDLLGPVVGKLQVITGGSRGIAPPAGFEKIPVDLNRGAGGDFIFLCMQKLTRARLSQAGINPITGLKVVYGKNTPAPAGYEKIDVDLNKGAGGEFVYLSYKRGEPEKAVRDIRIIHGNNASIEPPIPYTKLPQDLNKGSGGDWIFACYARV
ncbi:MAC/perforin domain-containing protein [Rhodococcus sp. O3]|uniref:MAC/perforin domain-containing protein n=1 Tax=Rhodococcus sp. O3 TaxID=3404919 RepID=UPI003B676DC0